MDPGPGVDPKPDNVVIAQRPGNKAMQQRVMMLSDTSEQTLGRWWHLPLKMWRKTLRTSEFLRQSSFCSLIMSMLIVPQTLCILAVLDLGNDALVLFPCPHSAQRIASFSRLSHVSVHPHKSTEEIILILLKYRTTVKRRLRKMYFEVLVKKGLPQHIFPVYSYFSYVSSAS